ncbi:hypothetical protein [Novosphingobium sp.]|uniref:hypothetical protein n=1 Tax=Novosphingobium sp. TaxID=1874826 RepID=UPI003D1261B7
MRFLVIMPVLLALGGCDKSATAPKGLAAGAQVLPGTTSDAMINLDQSQSHPLLNPDQSKHATAGDIMGEQASDAADGNDAPDNADPAAGKPAPKATPTD